MKCLGIDPGTRVAGYGIVKVEGQSVEVVDMGVIRMSPKKGIGERLLTLRSELKKVFEEHDPDCVYVERVFVYKSSESALKLKMANAIAHEIAAEYKKPCDEVSPSSAKKCATGNGSATKNAVRRSIQRICRMDSPPLSDAADAVAIALCGASRSSCAMP